MSKLGNRYRPSFFAVLLLANCTVLALPLLGAYALYKMYEGTYLVRKTEEKLIVQGALVAAAYTTAVSRLLISEDSRTTYGVPIADQWRRSKDTEKEFHPIKPRLSKLRDEIYPVAKDATAGTEPDPTAIQVGQELQPVLVEAQFVTLAGIRIVDFNGTVVASSGEELGKSLANRKDLQRALEGQYKSILRDRQSSTPPEERGPFGRVGRVRVFVNYPITLGERVLGAVVLSRTSPKGIETIRDLPVFVVLTLAILFSIVLAISIFVSIKINRPVKIIIQQAKRQLTERSGRFRTLDNPLTKEFAELSSSVTNLVNEQGRRANYARDLSADVTHAFKTPISGIGGAIELLTDGYTKMSDEERKSFMTIIEQEARKLNLLVERLLELTKANYLELDQVEKSIPSKIVEDITNDYRYKDLVINVDQTILDAEIDMAPKVFESIIIGLVDNAYQHGGKNITVEIELARPTDVENILRMIIRDNGQGILLANREKIFNHFWSTAAGSERSGLGLSIVRALLRHHNGVIDLLPSKSGAHFQIDIPVV